MRELNQKKEPTPAKGLTRIDTRISTSTINLVNKEELNNGITAYKLAVLKHTMVSGYSTYLKVLEGLGIKFNGGKK